MADNILYPWRDLRAGLYTRSHESERPPNSLNEDSRNSIWKHEHWRRKGGRSTYNPLAIAEPTANNIAQWRLNDNLGDTDVVDSSGNAHTGTSSANTSTLHATAKVGTGSFDFGGAAYVTVADAADLSFDDSDDKAFSLAAWVYVEASAGVQTIISKWDETTDAELREWQLSLTSAEKLILTLCDESANKLPTETADDALTAGWHHIVVTYDGGGGATAMAGVTIYVDGSAVASTGVEQASYVAMENTASAVIIGALEGTDGNPAFFLKEKGDDVRICNKELSTTEVTFLYNLGNGTESLLVEQEIRGLDHFNDGTTNALLTLCDANFYKTTGDTLMGTALTEPDATAVAVASANNDIEGVQIRNRTYLFNGDTADHPWVFDGTYIINYSRDATDGTADGAGTTTTLIDSDFGGGNDDYTGQYIEITDATAGTIHRAYVTDYVSATGAFTFSPARATATASGDTFTVGVALQEERNGKYPILHMDRIFVAVGSLVYFTEPGYPDVWSSISTGYPNIKYPGWNDGEDITALASMDEYVIIFKPHHIYVMRTIGDSIYWPMPRIVGTDSNKSCVWHRTLDRGFGGLIYMSWDGAYVLDRSLNVRCVSNNIEPTIQALIQSISNPGGISSVVKIDTTKADFDAGTATNIDTTTEAGTFRITPKTWVQTTKAHFDAGTDDPDGSIDTATVSGTFRVAKTAEAIDQQFTTNDANSPTIQPLAQSFKPSVSCILTKVSLYMNRVGTPPNVTVSLKYDSNNAPGTTICSKTLTYSSFGTSTGWVDFDLPDANLTSGVRYWIYIVPAFTGTPPTFTTYYNWGYKVAGGYADGQSYRNGIYDGWDFNFKVYEQHYNSSATLVSQTADLATTPTLWGVFNITQTLNGQTATWYVRSDNDSDMSSPTAWTVITSGNIPTITLQRYFQWKCVFSTDAWATPVVNDVTLNYLGDASSLVSQIHDIGAVPTSWGTFEATETLNGATVVYQVRSDDDSAMGSPTAWTGVENGGIPSITLQRYTQWKTILTTSDATITPVIDDVTIRAYIGTATESPCGIVWNKGYLLCVKDAGSTANNVAYRLDEDVWMREGKECWSPKLTGIKATKFIIFNDQLMSGSVGGEGLGGFLYYEDTGTKDLGSDFTTTLITKKHDFSDLDPTFRDRDKIFRKTHSKYKSQVATSLYYKTDDEDYSSAITLSAQANAELETDWFATAPRGKYMTLKVEQTVADPDWEWHGADIEMSVLRMR